MAKKSKSFEKKMQKSIDGWAAKRSRRVQWAMRAVFLVVVYAGALAAWTKLAGFPMFGRAIPAPDLSVWATRPALIVVVIAGAAVVVRQWVASSRPAKVGLSNPAVHVAALNAAAPGMIQQEEDRTPLVLEGLAESFHEDEATGVIKYRYKLPRGVVYENVGFGVGRSKYIASLDLDLPADQFTIEPYAGRPNWIEVTIKPPLPPMTGRPADLGQLTAWHMPLPIGRDKTTGKDVTIRLSGHAATLIAGQSGSGKTWLMRVIVGQLAPQRDVTLWIADGKDDVGQDWSLLKHRADKWVGLQDDDAAGGYVALLESALAEMKRRYADTTGTKYPLLLIVLEEYAGLRDSLGTNSKLVAEVDGMVRQLVMRCRAANIHVLLATQHPSAEAIPSAIRDQCATRICLHMPARRSVEMVLGYQPDQDDVPTREQHGHALVDINGQLVRVLCDEVTDSAWATFCGTLPAAHDPVDAPEGPQDGPTLRSEYQRIVDQPMTVTALWEALPTDLRGVSPAVLSRHLLPQIGVESHRGKAGSYVRPAADLPTPLPTQSPGLPPPAYTPGLHLVREQTPR